MRRRTFIRNFCTIAFGMLANLLHSKPGDAAWSAKHFASGEFSLQFKQLYADQPIIDSEDIHIALPEVAENGAVVPITISSDLEKISYIHIWAEKNPTPLVAEFALDEAVAPFLTARIKMAESCHVIVIAQQGERLLRKQQWVKVMQGGCGTG